MRFFLKCSEITAENNKRQFFKRVLNVLCKLAKIWYLVMSVPTHSNNINFEVCHRVLSQSVYALLSLILAMLNISTLSTNDQGIVLRTGLWQCQPSPGRSSQMTSTMT